MCGVFASNAPGSGNNVEALGRILAVMGGGFFGEGVDADADADADAILDLSCCSLELYISSSSSILFSEDE